MFPSDSLPDQIGQYKVIRRLSGAGSTDIFLARKEGPMGFQRLCVLKLVPTSSDEGDGGSADELAREAAICSRLNHPNIVRMFDFFEQDDKLVLVLEHVEGVTLDRLFQHLTTKRKRLGDDAVFYIGEQLASALAYAHAATDEEGTLTPVVHRNLHPDNIILSRDGRVHLTGFGIGKILGQTPDTVAGVVKGSPGYMAPEQVRGEPVTIRADVYGLGLLLWSLLLGRRRPPIDGKRPGQIALLRTDLSSEIAQMIDAALEPSVNKRILSCEEIQQALAKVVHNDAGKSELSEYLRTLLPAPRTPAPPPVAEEAEDERPTLPHEAKEKEKEKERVTPVPAAVGRRGPPAKPPPNRRDPVPAPEPRAAQAATKEPEKIEEAPKSVFPPLNMPPHSPEDLKSDAWKNSIPDLDVFDELFDKAKRDSTPTAPPASSLSGSMAPMAPAPGALKPMPAPTFGTPPMVAPPVAPMIRFGAPPPTPAPPTAAPQPAPAPVRFGPPPGAAAPPPIAPVLAPMPMRPMPFSPNGAPPPGAAPRFGRAPALSLMKGPRTLSTLGITVVVSAVTATLVAGVWLFIGFRDGSPPTRGQAADASSAATSVIAAPPRTAMPAESTASASPPPPAPTPTPAPPPPPAPEASSTAKTIPLETLPAGYGVLNVSFPAEANVYLMGKLIGPVNQDLKVLCGRFFLRLAETELVGRYPSWVTKGESVYIPCQERADLKMVPSPRGRR